VVVIERFIEFTCLETKIESKSEVLVEERDVVKLDEPILSDIQEKDPSKFEFKPPKFRYSFTMQLTFFCRKTGFPEVFKVEEAMDKLTKVFFQIFDSINLYRRPLLQCK
jgi:hypothetical protein